MRRATILPRGWRGFGAVLVLVGAAAPANGAILSFSADVESEVREFFEGTVTDTDVAQESFPAGTTDTLPMEAFAQLGVPAGVETVPAIGRAVTQFNDPRLSTQPSPEEIGVTAIVYSRDPYVFHEARCSATETRTVQFSPAEVFRNNGALVGMQSRFFVDGVLLVWGDTEGTDLSGVDATLRIRVESNRPGVGPITVLSGELVAEGQADGSVVSRTSGSVFSSGVVSVNIGGSALGPAVLQAIAIPDLVVPYPYEAVVGESFTLTAKVDAFVRTRPGGRGAAVVLGVPIDELASAVEQVAGVIGAEAVRDSLAARGILPGKAVGTSGADAALDVLEEPRGGKLPFFPACGLFGAESLVLLALASGWAGWRGSRR